MDFETLLGKIESSRPDLADSLSLIRQFNQERKDTQVVTSEDTGRVEELRTLLEKQKRINKVLMHQYYKLEDNYKALIAHLDQLAEAVGACPQCWGEDLTCTYCGGRGKPGYFQPNQQYFDTY